MKSLNSLTRKDYLIILALMLVAFAASVIMAWHVTERVPHLEDEATYLFQARIFARGALYAPPPPSEKSFFVPFALVVNEHWIGKYPIGWPLLLATGEAFGAGWLVNPAAGAVLTAVIYLAAFRLYGRHIAVLSGLLACSSPFFLIQSASYMSHIATGLWFALLLLAWLHLDEALSQRKSAPFWAITGGASIGMMVITRPLTAVALTVPFVISIAFRFVRGRFALKQLATAFWPFVLSAILVSAIQPAYLMAVTGSPTTNLYTLIWPYDRLGFGPAVGPYGGHTLRQAVINARWALFSWTYDLFGWPRFSWVPLVPGLIAAWVHGKNTGRQWPLLLGGSFVSLVGFYLLYWIGGRLYGPRYYFEAHAALAILAALGLYDGTGFILRLVPAIRRRDKSRLPEWAAYILFAALLALNITITIPVKTSVWHGLYDITRDPLDELESLAGDSPVLVFVEGNRWHEYAALFTMNSPWLDNEALAAHYVDPDFTAFVISHFPDHAIWFYDGDRFSQVPPE